MPGHAQQRDQPAHPANQEDHVSMATYGARRLADMAKNTAVVVGVEAMAAVQGMDFDRRLKSSPLIEAQYALIRSQVPYLAQDRYLAPDIETMRPCGRWKPIGPRLCSAFCRALLVT